MKREHKLTLAKLKKPPIPKEQKVEVVFPVEEIAKLHDEINNLYELVGKRIDTLDVRDDVKDHQQKLIGLNDQLVLLLSKFEQGINVNNFPEIKQETELTIKNLGDIPPATTAVKFPEWLAKDESIKNLHEQIIGLVVKFNDVIRQPTKLQIGQKPEDFLPVRRVKYTGNRLQFDDSTWSMAGGFGGGGSSTTVNVGLIPGTDYDYIDGQQTNATTDTFVYKLGGAGGTTVRTVVVIYTSAAKTDIDNIAYS